MQRNYSQGEKPTTQIKKIIEQTTNHPNKKFKDPTQLFTGGKNNQPNRNAQIYHNYSH